MTVKLNSLTRPPRQVGDVHVIHTDDVDVQAWLRALPTIEVFSDTQNKQWAVAITDQARADEAGTAYLVSGQAMRAIRSGFFN